MFDATAGDYTLHIDGSKIERVVGELISNAIKYTPEKGTVNIRLTTEENREGEAPAEPAQQITLSVQDSGIGLGIVHRQGIGRVARWNVIG